MLGQRRAESFFATIKRELIDTRPWSTRVGLRAAMFDFIEGWYNTRRLHSSLGYRSPAEYEATIHRHADRQGGIVKPSSCPPNRTNSTPGFFALGGMQGKADPNRKLLDAAALCRQLVPEGSFEAFLADHCHQLFPDTFVRRPSGRGRPSIPAEVSATAMVLQSLEGLSNREAARAVRDRIRWKVACGLALDDGSGLESRGSDHVTRPIGTQVLLLISAPPPSIPQS